MSLFRTLLASGVLLVSFAITSYVIGEYTASHEEQIQDDFINSYDGQKVVEIRDPLAIHGGGTGFFVKTPKGNSFILTNNHVCELAVDNTLLIDEEYFATIVAHSPDHDLCLVSNPFQEPGIPLASDSRDGQNIYVVGHPLLEPLTLIKGQISGTTEVDIMIGENISCKGKNQKEVDFGPDTIAALLGINSICIQAYEAQATTANILPGNSGSPVLNHDGKVVGVAFAGREDGPGRGYIIPLSYIKKFLSDK